MAGFRPSQVVIGIAGELVKGFTTAHSQERPRPDAPITEAELQKLIEGVQREALREAERSITWETGLRERRRPARPCRGRRRLDRRLCGDQPDRLPGPPRQDRDLRRVRAAGPPRGAPERRGEARPRARRGRGGAVRRGARAQQRPGSPGRRAVHRRRRRHDRRRARPAGRDRGDADVRAGRAGVHEVDRRSPGAAVPAGRGAQGGLRAGDRRATARQTSGRSSPTTSRSGRPAWSSSWRSSRRATSCPAGSTCAAAARGCRRSATRSRTSQFARRLPFARPPEVTIMAPDQVETIVDETKLLVDQQDVTPMGLAYQAIELGTSTGPLDAALRRVVQADADLTMTAIVYLDVDDEITSAAARIRALTDERIVLVLPLGSRLATSRINFRLLAREAETRGKRIEIVTSDASARALAASAGLPTHLSVAALEGRPAAAARPGRGRACAARPTRRPTLADAGHPAAGGASRRGAAGRPPPTAPRRVRSSPRSCCSSPWSRPAGTAAFLLLPSAEIVLTPASDPVGPLELERDRPGRRHAAGSGRTSSCRPTGSPSTWSLRHLPCHRAQGDRDGRDRRGDLLQPRTPARRTRSRPGPSSGPSRHRVPDPGRGPAPARPDRDRQQRRS